MMSAPARPGKNARTTTVLVESDFKSYMQGMHPDDQKKVFTVIRWFEASPQNRGHGWAHCEGSPRRKLRYIRASNHLRVIYSEGNTRRWVWAGRYADFRAMTEKLDKAPLDAQMETIDVETMLDWIRGIKVKRMEPASSETTTSVATVVAPPPVEVEATAPAQTSLIKPPQDEVDLLVGAADNAAMFVSDVKAVWESILTKLVKVKSLRERVAAETTAQPQPQANDGPKVDLASYNEARRKVEILTERLQAAEKRAKASDFTQSQVEQIRRMSANENRALKAEVEKLRTEAAALRTALQRTQDAAVKQALTEKAKDDLKDKCSRVLDDQARILGMTGRANLQEQAEELGRLAIKIRALKL